MTESKERKKARIKAYRAVEQAIKQGLLVRPTQCSKCGKTPEGKRGIHAAHLSGYDEAHQLDVTWLCVSCHKKADTTHEQRVQLGRQTHANLTPEQKFSIAQKGGLAAATSPNQTRGSAVPNSILKEEQVLQILQLLALPEGERPLQKEIAKHFNVYESRISRIKSREQWRHVQL